MPDPGSPAHDLSLLPTGEARPPVSFPHFPDALHAVIWRNWGLVNVERLGRVLTAEPQQLIDLAASMGLPPAAPVSAEQAKRSYITVIRRNWHLLPYEQLLDLLGWDASHLAYTLKEDDFLWHKLGAFKPECPPVSYSEPSPDAREQAAWIRQVVIDAFGDALAREHEPPFAFLKELTALPSNVAMLADRPAPETVPPRFLYSYFALYGDPLADPELDPFPDGYLARLAELGVNGVWLQGVLNKLSPWALAPELSAGYEARLENLRRLTERTRRFGIGVYLYLNEPRAMPASFFEQYPHLRGAYEAPFYALCTSTPEVQDFLRESAAFVFGQVPELAGAFTISMSENLTNCFSRWGGDQCPRCAARGPAAVVSEVNRLLAEGVWRSKPDAHFIVWDWGWEPHIPTAHQPSDYDWTEDAIRQLPEKAWLQSISELGVPIARGGVPATVNEYCLSVAGPGPRARRHWAAARDHGMRISAKLQLGCTWELSAVPYIPVEKLIAQHMVNLRREGVDGLMLGWTLGGYPSPNLELAATVHGPGGEGLSPEDAMLRVTERRFGPAAAPHVVAAWEQFSDAFAEFPFDIMTVYVGPQQMGPANLLWRAATGYRATMVGFPYDDLEGWAAIYPPDVYLGQWRKIADGWAEGLRTLTRARAVAPSPALDAEWRVAEAAYLHFCSVANQVEFVMVRDQDRARTRELLTDEETLARRLFDIVDGDSRIGFEATNHYYYTRLDLVEKVLNCRWLARGC
jgi:hypothetical protein